MRTFLALGLAAVALAGCGPQQSKEANAPAPPATGSVAAEISGANGSAEVPATSPIVGTPDPKVVKALKFLLVDDAVGYATGVQALFTWKSLPYLTVQTTPITLWQEYQSNEIAADRKYNGKGVIISGMVDGVHSEGATNYVDFVAPGYSGIRGYLAVQMTDEAASYRRGQTVSLGCIGMGKNVTVIMLDGCVSEGRIKAEATDLVDRGVNNWLKGIPSTITVDNPDGGVMMKKVYDALAALPANSTCFSTPTTENCNMSIGSRDDAKPDA